MNSGAAFSQIRMAADSELRYYFSCLMLGDRAARYAKHAGHDFRKRPSVFSVRVGRYMHIALFKLIELQRLV